MIGEMLFRPGIFVKEKLSRGSARSLGMWVGQMNAFNAPVQNFFVPFLNLCCY